MPIYIYAGGKAEGKATIYIYTTSNSTNLMSSC